MKGEDGRSLLEMALDGDFPEGYLLPTSDWPVGGHSKDWYVLRLLENGADPNTKGTNGVPLLLKAKQMCAVVVRNFLRYGATPLEDVSTHDEL